MTSSAASAHHNKGHRGCRSLESGPWDSITHHRHRKVIAASRLLAIQDVLPANTGAPTGSGSASEVDQRSVPAPPTNDDTPLQRVATRRSARGGARLVRSTACRQPPRQCRDAGRNVACRPLPAPQQAAAAAGNRGLEATFRESFAGRMLPFDAEAAAAYAAVIVVARRNLGRPISQCDTQIAAIAPSRRAGLTT